MEMRRTSPGLFWLTTALTVLLLAFGIANLTGIGYPPGDENWRTFVGVFSIINAQFLLAGLLVTDYRSRLGTVLLSLGAMLAFLTFAPLPLIFQVHALAIFALAIRRARRRSRARYVVTV